MSAGDGAAVGGVGGHGAVVVDLVEDGFELLGRVGADLDAGEAGVVLLLAELDVLDVVPAAARQDLVEHLGQQQRIDDVAGHLDVFDKGGLHGPVGGHRTSPRLGMPVILPTGSRLAPNAVDQSIDDSARRSSQ